MKDRKKRMGRKKRKIPKASGSTWKELIQIAKETSDKRKRMEKGWRKDGERMCAKEIHWILRGGGDEDMEPKKKIQIGIKNFFARPSGSGDAPALDRTPIVVQMVTGQRLSRKRKAVQDGQARQKMMRVRVEAPEGDATEGDASEGDAPEAAGDAPDVTPAKNRPTMPDTPPSAGPGRLPMPLSADRRGTFGGNATNGRYAGQAARRHELTAAQALEIAVYLESHQKKYDSVPEYWLAMKARFTLMSKARLEDTCTYIHTYIHRYV